MYCLLLVLSNVDQRVKRILDFYLKSKFRINLMYMYSGTCVQSNLFEIQ